MRNWTPEQLLGITVTDRSVLLSAAAGSGKTAVLAERCAHLVCDASPPADVDQLLVVTFTEAAAAEMKERIRRALRDRSAAAPTPRVVRQLAGVERASVGTLHGFCANLLRRHYTGVGLDPGFVVIDADEARLLRSELARELLAERYAGDDDGTFQQLVDDYCDGADAKLAAKLLAAYETMTSLVDPAGWVERSLHRVRQGAAVAIEESELGRDFIAGVRRALADVRRQVAAAMAAVRAAGAFPAYVERVGLYDALVRDWQAALEHKGLAALCDAVREPPNFGRLPPVKAGTPGKDVAKAAVDDVTALVCKGDWRIALRFTPQELRDGLAKVAGPTELFLSLVRQFADRYTEAKRANRGVDFADLERLALKLLQTSDGRPTAAARACHKRYRHVLVDEYQDINELQDAILRLVSTECLRGKDEGRRMKDENGADASAASPFSSFILPPSSFPPGNLFCVGDVKQSIYRFRLADPSRFIARSKAFDREPAGGGGRIIDLQKNFRSRGPLLEAINTTFERLMTEAAADITYDASQRLNAGATFPLDDGGPRFDGAPIELHVLPADVVGDDADDGADLERAEREGLFIADRIKQMLGLVGSAPARVATADGYRDARPRDVAILLRTRKFKIGQYATALRQAGVAVHADGGSGFFASQEVSDVLALLRLLDNRRQDVPMAAVLRSPIAALAEPEDALARVRLAYPTTPDQPVPFCDAAVRYAREQDDELAARLRDFFKQLDEWRELARRRPLAELLSHVYEQSGYLAFCCGLPDGPQRRANLLELHRRAAQFGSFHRQGLSRFMQFLNSLEEESDLGQASVASEAADAVRVLTIHESKGLEFPIVFLADLGKAINLSDCGGPILLDRAAGLGLQVADEHRQVRYPSLAYLLVQQRLRQQAMAEELRVLYVAMTRAKEHLICVGTAKGGCAEKWAAKWSAHDGPLPAEDVLAARTMLDWLGPVAAACAGGEQPVIELTAHTGDVVGAIARDAKGKQASDPHAAALAALEPLDPAPPPHPDANLVIARLTFAYPHVARTNTPAAASVTGLAKRQAARFDRENEFAPTGAAAVSLTAPRFLGEPGATPAAVDAGTATHVVLQHVDFTTDAGRVRERVDELVRRKLLTAALAAAVDVASIEWFLSHPLSKRLAAAGDALRREMPVYFPQGDAADPLDRVMVRGRLDVFLPTDKGGVIVDYKTDDVDATTLHARADDYRGQMREYAAAIDRITGKRPEAVYLVFLRAREVVEA